MLQLSKIEVAWLFIIFALLISIGASSLMAALDIRKDIIGFCENTCVAVGSELKSLDLYGECTCENGVEIYPHDLKSR